MPARQVLPRNRGGTQRSPGRSRAGGPRWSPSSEVPPPPRSPFVTASAGGFGGSSAPPIELFASANAQLAGEDPPDLFGHLGLGLLLRERELLEEQAPRLV